MSAAIQNSSSPPAIWNAGSVMLSRRSRISPISAAPIRIAPADAAALGGRKPFRHANEDRRQPDRIDHDRKRDEG